MKIPFVNLQAQHAPLRSQISMAIEAVIDSGDFSNGGHVKHFEQEFAQYCGTRYAVGVGSGTDAIRLSLMGMGVGPGDEVITVPMTFFATAEAISMSGANPVFVDIDELTYTMNPDLLASAISSRTKAIIPVHLFGHPADMEPILKVAGEFGLPVIEDASQAHGAFYKRNKVGSFGSAGCFSFYPTKNLGAMGDAGAVVTDDFELAEKIRSLRNHGQFKRNEHQTIGLNSRMDGIQAVILSLKLKHLDTNNELRRRIARCYQSAFKGIDGIIPPIERESATHSYHIYAIQAIERESVIRALDENGIGHSIHYPIPLHLQPAYSDLGYQEGQFPVSEQCSRRFVSIPLYPELSRKEIAEIIRTIHQCPNAARIF